MSQISSAQPDTKDQKATPWKNGMETIKDNMPEHAIECPQTGVS
jgi:hypothetical protein